MKKNRDKEEDIENIYDKDNEELEKNTGMTTGGLEDGVLLLPTPIPDRPSVPKKEQAFKLPDILTDLHKNIAGGQKMLSKLSQPAVDRVDMTLKSILLVLCKIYETLEANKEK